jgi:hypothetical protein
MGKYDKGKLHNHEYNITRTNYKVGTQTNGQMWQEQAS